MAKTKHTLKWQRDPEGMRLRILAAAKQEFSAHGLAGARVDRIAAKAGANKRMLYYHVGKKDDLYLEVLEGAYEQIRVEERALDLEHLDPPEAIERLISFTWNYFIRNPEFLALLNTENLAKARHLKRSTKVKSMHSPFVEMIRTVVNRGVESVQLHPPPLALSKRRVHLLSKAVEQPQCFGCVHLPAKLEYPLERPASSFLFLSFTRIVVINAIRGRLSAVSCITIKPSSRQTTDFSSNDIIDNLY